MSASRRVTSLVDRLFDRLRHPSAFAVGDQEGTDGTFDGLRHHKYALLVTFRDNGEAVPSPVWAAVDHSGTAYVKTTAEAGKVRRLRHGSRVLIAPCDVRGRPLGPVVRGIARILANDEWGQAEETLTSAYGAGRKMSERLLGGSVDRVAYIAITPERAPDDHVHQRGDPGDV